MKKQILSISLAAALAVSCTGIAMAEDKTPTVFVNQGQIFFDDQAPVILGEGTTLVPARGVFEAMGAKVEWKEDTRTVDVTSSDNKTLIRLTIDDSTMKVFDVSGVFGALMSGQDFVAPENDVTLDVAPQIISDRTMIPLRAISEALDADVQWNGEDYTINITTANAPSADAGVPALSLSADKLTAAKDEKFVSGVTATVKYDPTAFEFVKAELVNGDNVIEGAIGAANPEFTYGYVKAASITVNAETAVTADGAVMKLTFKSLTGEKGSFQLSNGYNTKLGYNTSLLVDSVSNVGNKSVQYEGDDLKISQAEVVINGTDTPAETVKPTTTADPTATVAPEATADPTATVAPEATADPSATVAPTAAPAETAAPTATPAA